MACCSSSAFAQTDILPFGNGSAEIKQVFSAKLYNIDYRSYLVTFEGADIVISGNPNLAIPQLKVGDKIDFTIIRIKGSAGVPGLYFVQTDIEAEKKLLMSSAKAPVQSRPLTKEIELKIGKDGDIFLDSAKCPETELSKKLGALDSKKVTIVLVSHSESKYDITVRVLDILKKAGIENVLFTADSEE